MKSNLNSFGTYTLFYYNIKVFLILLIKRLHLKYKYNKYKYYYSFK